EAGSHQRGDRGRAADDVFAAVDNHSVARGRGGVAGDVGDLPAGEVPGDAATGRGLRIRVVPGDLRSPRPVCVEPQLRAAAPDHRRAGGGEVDDVLAGAVLAASIAGSDEHGDTLGAGLGQHSLVGVHRGRIPGGFGAAPGDGDDVAGGDGLANRV